MAIILFDVDGVLIHGYHANLKFRRCWDENLENDFGISRSDFTDHFIRGVFEQKVLVGKIDLYSALKKILPNLGYGGDPQTLIDYWMKEDSKVNTKLLPFVERLSVLPGVSLYIATNQEHVRACYLMEQVGFGKYFRDIFHSARVGYTKPNCRYFRKVEALLKHQVDQKIILFDDNQDVIHGALEAGWEAHLFNVPEDIFKSKTVSSLLAH